MPTRPRYELDNACVIKGWNDADLATRLDPKVNAETVRRWRTGEQTPYKYHITQMCVLFDVKHPKELNLDAQFNASTQCSEDEIIAMLYNYDRRQLLEIFSKLPAFAGIDLTVLFSTTVIAPEKLLNVCETVVNGCWDMLNQSIYSLADGILSVCVSELESLATHSSKYQQEAASLVVDATIIQMIIATHKPNYARRKRLGTDAVRFGEMSGDRDLYATALGWHGNMYLYNQPETAIAILNRAIPCLNNNAPLNQADIYMELARAHALDEKESDAEARKAREYALMARMAMPEYPEQYPLYRLIELGQSELDAREGRLYLILARRFPAKKEYVQLAYDALMKSTRNIPINKRSLAGILIAKAEAACVIKNMNQYFDCLEEGIPIVKQTGSQKQTAKAVATLQKAPRGWRNEQRYKDLDAIVREIMTPRKIRR